MPQNSLANVNLFANQSASPATFHSDADLFAAANSGLFTETKSSNPTNISSFDPFAASDSIFSSSSESNVPSTNPTSSCAIDPFAAIQVSNVTGSDELFGSFTSNTAPASRDPSKDSSNTSQSASKKEPFQVKSGIWADSLSRGLIDLNITAQIAREAGKEEGEDRGHGEAGKNTGFITQVSKDIV
ncbi:Clathrin interactor EPSIN 1 [Dendrobium catenatum]|uniref:Clathrin interactor EPSIN 1 n=1 Tax=Dendrobium catenatum TaxID=906689 RepID=A0A2I0VUA5_9ASPA|nr:Clathrin interactor EPSIN 1 [Dendrobium catenatum]